MRGETIQRAARVTARPPLTPKKPLLIVNRDSMLLSRRGSYPLVASDQAGSRAGSKSDFKGRPLAGLFLTKESTREIVYRDLIEASDCQVSSRSHQKSGVP